MSDVFLSYARKQTQFVRLLHGALTKRSREVWVDWRDIPPTAEWLQEVFLAIDNADAFLFVISQDSIASTVCNQEINHAVKHSKRIIPILRQNIDIDHLHRRVRSIQWIAMRKDDDFGKGLDLLVTALETDLPWVKEHTRLLGRARDWELSGRDCSFVLRDQELTRAREWLRRADKSRRRSASDAHRELIAASEEYQTAELHRTQESYKRAQARLLTAQAQLLYTQRSTYLERGILLAAEALSRWPSVEADQATRVGLSLLPRRLHKLQFPNAVSRFMLSPDASLIAVIGYGHLGVWRVEAGTLMTSQKIENIWDIAFSPDGKRLVVVLGEQPIQILDPLSGALLQEITHHHSLNRVRWSVDGEILCAAGWKTGGLWNAITGLGLGQFSHDDNIAGMELSADTKWLATGDMKGYASLWSVPDATLVAQVRLEGHVTRVAFDRGNNVIAMEENRGFTMFNSAGATISKSTFECPARDLAVSPNGRLVAIGCGNLAQLCQPESGRLLTTMRLDEHFADAIMFDESGQRVATAGSVLAAVWDVASGKELARIVTEPTVADLVALSGTGNLIATLQDERTIGVWAASASAAEAELTLPGNAGAIAFNPASNLVAVTCDSGAPSTRVRYPHDTSTNESLLIVASISSGQEVFRDVFRRGFAGAVCFDFNGTSLAVACETEVRLWDTHTWTLIKSVSHGDLVQAVVASPDGRWASADRAGEVCLFDIESRGIRARVALNHPIGEIVFSQRTGELICTTNEQRISFLEFATGRRRRKSKTISPAWLAAISSNGRVLCIGPSSSPSSTSVDILRTPFDKVLTHLDFDAQVDVFAVSPDGRRACIAISAHESQKYELVVWRVDEQKEERRLVHDAGILCVAFSPDNAFVATGARDGSARVWSVEVGKECARIDHASYVHDVRFSADGALVGTAGWDQRAVVWRWRHDELLDEVGRRVSRNLTADEWARYIPDEEYEERFEIS